MPAYQGRALQHAAPRRPPRTGRMGKIVRVLLFIAVLVGLAHVPWDALRRRAITVSEIRVEGLHYLDAASVARRSGLQIGDGWLNVDLARARQALLRDSRIREAKVERSFPRVVMLRIEERVPVLLTRHGSPWELDAEGVLLAPLKEGVVADVPMLTGVDAERYQPGTCLATSGVKRGLAWVRATAEPELELAGRISEIDVSDSSCTGLVLMTGTHVLSTAWPPSTRTLSALRVVLADLERRGTLAQEVDMRYRNQVIVRPVPGAPGAATGSQPG
jgi:cell division protein FtsQ